MNRQYVTTLLIELLTDFATAMAQKFEIRNNTAEFLIFQIEGKEDGVQVVYHNESVWCTQKAMAELFDVGVPAISKHLNNILPK